MFPLVFEKDRGKPDSGIGYRTYKPENEGNGSLLDVYQPIWYERKYVDSIGGAQR